jgi:lysozyme
MKTSPDGRKLIESFEGLILTAYDDYNDHVVKLGDAIHGTLTIGYGHTTAAGSPSVFVGQTISKDEADQILEQDLAKVEKEVNSLVAVPLTQDQFDALVSFQFNTGALGKSTLLKLLNNSNYPGAANEFLKWTHASGRVLPGLIRRRQAERKLFLTPILTTITKPTVVITQGKTHPMLQFLSSLVGPTQIGGWVRALVASGLTALAVTTGLPFLSDPTVTGGIATAVATVVVGLWSSLAKVGTVPVPVTDGSVVSVSNPDTTHVIPTIPHETTHP